MSRAPLQTFCLVQDAGWQHMHDYDVMPPAIRRQVAAAPFNICAACLNGRAVQLYHPEDCPMDIAYKNALAEFYAQWRTQDHG